MNSPARAVDHARAGWVTRGAANLVDVVVVSTATAVAAIVAFMLRSVFFGAAFTVPRVHGAATAVLLPLVFVGYLAFFWASTGRTPGNQAAGLRVLMSDGQRIGLLRSIARAILCVAFPVGFVWIAFSRRNLAIHDVIVGTVVVYDWGSPKATAARIHHSDGA